ncbi:hypothetical protein DFH07DRAFT_785181 [Mycena maculata]|uniref:Uncharacterized protein n=1 Tax=Mycena maculata TaxID=230809 RepID=A0AAD7HDB5_9AGAR|nr:hypothetical protein DFH07DRAFT_785181 [Mycena maculata]
MPSGGASMYGSLVKLEVTNVPEHRWPTATVFVAILTAARSLEVLLMNHFGVSIHTNSANAIAFTLPHLRSLELDISKIQYLMLRPGSHPRMNDYDAHTFLSAFPDICQLDICTYGQAFVNALDAALTLAPLLCELAVGDTTITALHLYVMGRQNYDTVDLLVYYVGAESEVSHSDEELLVVAELVVEMRSRLATFETYTMFPL